MAKERTMNEYRQTKEYTVPYVGININKPKQVKEYKQRDLNSDTGEECPLDPVEEAKILIVDKITKHFQDIMFEMVNEEMNNHYVFQSQNYLTEAGYEMFEDEWFEFYHTHHGDVLYEVMQNITN